MFNIARLMFIAINAIYKGKYKIQILNCNFKVKNILSIGANEDVLYPNNNDTL